MTLNNHNKQVNICNSQSFEINLNISLARYNNAQLVRDDPDNALQYRIIL